MDFVFCFISSFIICAINSIFLYRLQNQFWTWPTLEHQHVCVCMYVCMHACMHVCMYVCMYVYMYVCMYIYMYIYIYLYIYTKFRPSFLSRCYRVGDNRRTVNTSTPYISDRSGTETRVKHRFIIMIWVLACNNMYRYERHFGSFYHNPTILETVSILASKYVNGSTRKIFCIEIQWQGKILAPTCLCQGKMWKSHLKNIFHIPRWPVGVK